MNERLRDALPLLAWTAILATTIVAFTAMGSGPLAGPPLADPGAWSSWAGDREPVVATVAVLRLLVLAMAWYLAGVTAVGAVARVARLAALVRVSDAVSLPVVRRVLQASLGVGLVTAVAVSSTPGLGTRTEPAPVLAAAGQELDAPEAPRMRPLPPRRAPVPTPAPTTDADRSAPQPVGKADPTPAASAPAPPDEDTPPPQAPTAPDGDAPATVTVRPGDHLWSIAEQHLGGHTDTAPSDEQVTAYWRRLIDANRDRLVDAANPDLILPGQQFVLPALDGTDGPDRP